MDAFLFPTNPSRPSPAPFFPPCTVLVESLTPRFALFLVTALMLEQPVLLVAAPGSDELLMHAGEWIGSKLGRDKKKGRLQNGSKRVAEMFLIFRRLLFLAFPHNVSYLQQRAACFGCCAPFSGNTSTCLCCRCLVDTFSSTPSTSRSRSSSAPTRPYWKGERSIYDVQLHICRVSCTCV